MNERRELVEMWLFTQDGFYSVVKKGPGGKLVVRAREPGALEALRAHMPGLGPEEVTPRGDYRYRAYVSAEDLAVGLAAVGESIDYSNFKSRVDSRSSAHRSSRFAGALHRVWGVMERIQPGGAYGVGGRDYPPIPEGEPKGGAGRQSRLLL